MRGERALIQVALSMKRKRTERQPSVNAQLLLFKGGNFLTDARVAVYSSPGKTLCVPTNASNPHRRRASAPLRLFSLPAPKCRSRTFLVSIRNGALQLTFPAGSNHDTRRLFIFRAFLYQVSVKLTLCRPRFSFHAGHDSSESTDEKTRTTLTRESLSLSPNRPV